MQVIVRRLLSKDKRTLMFSAKDKAFDDAADALAIAIHHAWKVSGKAVTVLAAAEMVKKETAKNLSAKKKEKRVKAAEIKKTAKAKVKLAKGKNKK